MNSRETLAVVLCLGICFIMGCSSLLPSSKAVTRSSWGNFADAKKSFDRVSPGQTTTAQLKSLGFDLYSTPNVRILNYLDIAIATQSLKRDEMDTGFRECFVAKNKCMAYEFAPQYTHDERYGNFWLDLFNFRRKTKETGWQFRAMFIVIDNIVVDKFWGGSPSIEQDRQTKNPLGPLQDGGSLLFRAVP